ncbi:hypothetical protein [Sphingomonas aracearum]|uniref:S9 family peptidase n=1 Tax=Sphingomonas aracearum TaxID=2283317 RepID=A0A369VWD0_9SPHN|nr:hypothetical protein [Sphingomonas aracearum]RDE06696.1 hypothetical protein DVW87_03075 [Sphingomonas aracearum]
MAIAKDETPDAAALRSYRISFSLPVPRRGTLVVYDYLTAGDDQLPIAGREVFLIDHRDVIWQIDPEPGTTGSRAHEFDPAIRTTEPFVNVYAAGDTFYASRFNGDTFAIDMDTGHATYVGWART